MKVLTSPFQRAANGHLYAGAGLSLSVFSSLSALPLLHRWEKVPECMTLTEDARVTSALPYLLFLFLRVWRGTERIG